MNNENFELKLQAYVDGELPAQETAAVRERLAGDAAGQALVAELRNTRTTLVENESELKLPESREFFWSKVQREIERQENASVSVPKMSWIAWVRHHLVSVGGAALLTCLMAVMLLHGRGTGSLGEMEMASDEMGTYTYRDQQAKMTLVWFYDKSDDSEFTEPAAIAEHGSRMKRHRFTRILIFAAVCLLGIVAYQGVGAATEPVWVKVQLVWGTDAEKSPDTRHKALDDDLSRKLGKSPFRWKHYFEVNRQTVAIALGEAKSGIKMSSHCVIDLKNLGKDRIETKLYGKGKLLSTHKETVQKDWPLILAGNAENETAWLVVITKIDPPAKQAATPVAAPK